MAGPPPASFLNIFHQNIQGIKRKFKIDEFNIFLASMNSPPDILCLSEHWVSAGGEFIFRQIKGYDLKSYFIRKNQARGGVAILAGETVQCCQRRDIEHYSREGVLECSGVQINGKVPTVVLCIYRPPKNNQDTVDLFFFSCQMC